MTHALRLPELELLEAEVLDVARIGAWDSDKREANEWIITHARAYIAGLAHATTRARYNSVLRSFTTWLAAAPNTTQHTGDPYRYVETAARIYMERREWRSANYLKYVRSVIRAFFSYLQNTGLAARTLTIPKFAPIFDRDAIEVKQRRQLDRAKNYIRPEELAEKLFPLLKRQNTRLYIATLLMYTLMLRAQDVCRVQRKHFFLADGVWYLQIIGKQELKNNSAALVAIPRGEVIVPLCLAYMDSRGLVGPDAFLIASLRWPHDEIGPQVLQGEFNVWVSPVLGRHIVLHDFRRGRATDLIAREVSFADIEKLGRMTPATARRYDANALKHSVDWTVL